MRRAVGPVELLTSWREPPAGDTRDEWTYLACCSKCARHMLQVCIRGRRRGQNAGGGVPEGYCLASLVIYGCSCLLLSLQRILDAVVLSGFPTGFCNAPLRGRGLLQGLGLL